MQKCILRIFALAFVAQCVVRGATLQTRAQEAKTSYPRMAPIDQYLMDQSAEIALARSALQHPFPTKPKSCCWAGMDIRPQ